MLKPIVIRCMCGAGALSLCLTGCGARVLNGDVGADQLDVAGIVNSTTLTDEQKRDELAAFGMSPVVLNGLLGASRLANQFGGNLATAYDKVVNGQYSLMTPDEVQYYGDAAAISTLSDEEAQAIVTLFQKNSLNDADQLSAFLDNSANVVPSEIDSENLRALFVDFDPAEVIDQLP